MTLKTSLFDPTRYLDSEEAIQEFLIAMFEDGSPAEIAAAIGTVAKARGMTQLAKETGLSRPALYKALSEDGNPGLDTIMKVLAALGVRLTVVPSPDKAA
ncbi:MAG: putative addiction module antidote protein [Candidatus Kaistia colombiensis]|nr:MAG: putative addiction module antidote protein [Kaistia sp.]